MEQLQFPPPPPRDLKREMKSVYNPRPTNKCNKSRNNPKKNDIIELNLTLYREISIKQYVNMLVVKHI